MRALPPLNIDSNSSDWRARRLSNFSDDPFVLDGTRLASVEGFIQGIKFPEGDPSRKLAFVSVGTAAKKLGKKAPNQFFPANRERVVWWDDKIIPYGSFLHHKLIERAIRAKFEQNERARKALQATVGIKLIHDLGYPESARTSLPSEIFCDILNRIRSEFTE